MMRRSENDMKHQVLSPNITENSSDQGIYLVDRQGFLLFYNDKIKDIWNVSPTLYSCTTSLKWYKPDGTALTEDQYPSSVALQYQRSFHNEKFLIERHDGSRRMIVVNIDPVYDSNNELIGVLNIFNDVTVKQDDILLGKMTAFAESSDDAIISKDLDGTILSWNYGAQRIFGYTAREVLGKSGNIIIPETHLQEGEIILNKVLQGQSIYNLKTKRQTKPDSQFRFL